MKKIVLFLISIFALASCTNHDIEQLSSDYIVKTYNEAFLDYVGGSIAPTQDWGFNTDFSNIAGTRSVIKENHELPAGLTKPTLKSGEAAFVMDWFSKNPGENSVGLNISKFFIVYVGATTSVQAQEYNSGSLVSTTTQNVVLDYLTINGEHINDWNANNGPTVYVYNSKADKFTAHNSYADYTTAIWKLAKITYDGEDGWYVGLTAYGKKSNGSSVTDDNRKDYFENWVFKIVPAEAIPDKKEFNIRVIAEDLSVSDDTDFDFNDVVFDVAIDKNNKKTWVRVKAAGGTYPLTIDDNEVHNLLGVSTKTMYNTGWQGESINFDFYKEIELKNYYENAKDIPIVVLKDGHPVTLYANTGQPASKIGVPTTFHWCKERESIKGNYPLFSDWVINNKITAWW
jgi:hypothetical protein